VEKIIVRRAIIKQSGNKDMSPDGSRVAISPSSRQELVSVLSRGEQVSAQRCLALALKRSVGGDRRQLKAKAELGSPASTLAVFKVSAFKQSWKLGYVMCNSVCTTRSSGTGSEILI